MDANIDNSKLTIPARESVTTPAVQERTIQLPIYLKDGNNNFYKLVALNEYFDVRFNIAGSEIKHSNFKVLPTAWLADSYKANPEKFTIITEKEFKKVYDSAMIELQMEFADTVTEEEETPNEKKARLNEEKGLEQLEDERQS